MDEIKDLAVLGEIGLSLEVVVATHDIQPREDVRCCI
jgi:hypothetical protein